MPGQIIGGGELQTLISTLQNTNTQLGHIYTVLTKINAGVGGPAQTSAAAAAEPEGYFVMDVPGVGPRRVPYYPE